MPKPDAVAVIEQYKSSLDEYTLEQLRYKSEVEVWSVGQMSWLACIAGIICARRLNWINGWLKRDYARLRH